MLYCEKLKGKNDTDGNVYSVEVKKLAISKAEVYKVAALARLKLSEQEADQFTSQLNDILEFANKLNELDTENVQPTSHVLPIHNVFREDEVRSSTDRDKALKNAPEQQDHMFYVPAVFE
ncbi:Asp-tRNA(Asn)/Glu-tRNA(Gln) amidotransferase subunit GatC [Thermoactinomyces mirandus]|uniref:Aspartyl/glutamyl-tRNA(Asn/Gln) amidotransferase subunit C n=1 Tax=Thermoactinomyces mirandus TaxID=2756294 RepID=A0A7W2ARD0_9BACL|nr:Asp-tRNA(Asn)/Glu-tRNA(Gln) amidotransferase subunit GatC [Thermoactinomyces mirandus]MBA4602212.1 Asp-tRNA(Asn)/Glu-tRNA(Gln) amidotransferase subunit GatC [Thermoactinomyces mirandus]